MKNCKEKVSQFWNSEENKLEVFYMYVSLVHASILFQNSKNNLRVPTRI